MSELRDQKTTIAWVGESLEEANAFPEPARLAFAFRLFIAQLGGASGVPEIRLDIAGISYRLVYSSISSAIYVLHAFSKETWRKTPFGHVETIRHRMSMVAAAHNDNGMDSHCGSDYVFADLCIALDPGERERIYIAAAICQSIEANRLTQGKAARVAGTIQSRLSAIMRGRMAGLSKKALAGYLERLAAFDPDDQV
jgi:phage-related protein